MPFIYSATTGDGLQSDGTGVHDDNCFPVDRKVGGNTLYVTAAELLAYIQAEGIAPETTRAEAAEAAAAAAAAAAQATANLALPASVAMNIQGGVVRIVTSKLEDQVSLYDFGAIGNGTSHPLSSITTFGASNTTGWTLTQWKTIFPSALALTDELDLVAWESAMWSGRYQINVPQGIFMVNRQPQIPASGNLLIRGMGTANYPTPITGTPGTSSPGSSGGSAFRRTADFILVPLNGISVNVSGTNSLIQRVCFQHLTFDGGDHLNSGVYYASPLISTMAAYRCDFDQCTFYSAQCSWYSTEYWDSRITNCVWEYCGSQDGVIAGVWFTSSTQVLNANGTPYLVSGNPVYYDSTNNIYFWGCRWEPSLGNSLRMDGANGIDIFITDCKIECDQSLEPLIRSWGCSGISFGGNNWMYGQGEGFDATTYPGWTGASASQAIVANPGQYGSPPLTAASLSGDNLTLTYNYTTTQVLAGFSWSTAPAVRNAGHLVLHRAASGVTNPMPWQQPLIDFGTVVSVMSMTIATGISTSTLWINMPVVVQSAANPSNAVFGRVAAYNATTGALIVFGDYTVGNSAATDTSWTVRPAHAGLLYFSNGSNVKGRITGGYGGATPGVGCVTNAKAVAQIDTFTDTDLDLSLVSASILLPGSTISALHDTTTNASTAGHVGAGTFSFTVETGRSLAAGAPLTITGKTQATRYDYMYSTVLSYNSSTGALSVRTDGSQYGGVPSDNINSWVIMPTVNPLVVHTGSGQIGGINPRSVVTGSQQTFGDAPNTVPQAGRNRGYTRWLATWGSPNSVIENLQTKDQWTVEDVQAVAATQNVFDVYGNLTSTVSFMAGQYSPFYVYDTQRGVQINPIFLDGNRALEFGAPLVTSFPIQMTDVPSNNGGTYRQARIAKALNAQPTRATVTVTNTSGALSCALNVAGSGYGLSFGVNVAQPTLVTLTAHDPNGTGSGFAGTGTISNTGVVSSINVSAGGANYSSNTTVTVDGGLTGWTAGDVVLNSQPGTASPMAWQCIAAAYTTAGVYYPPAWVVLMPAPKSTLVTASGAAQTVTFVPGETTFDVTLSANTTITHSFGSAIYGTTSRMTLIVRQPASGGPYTLTFASGISWAAGTAPTLNTAANGVTGYTFITSDLFHITGAAGL
jgi:hypothetical protein